MAVTLAPELDQDRAKKRPLSHPKVTQNDGRNGFSGPLGAGLCLWPLNGRPTWNSGDGTWSVFSIGSVFHLSNFQRDQTRSNVFFWVYDTEEGSVFSQSLFNLSHQQVRRAKDEISCFLMGDSIKFTVQKKLPPSFTSSSKKLKTRSIAFQWVFLLRSRTVQKKLPSSLISSSKRRKGDQPLSNECLFRLAV